MTLNPETLSRRLAAARALAGLSQKDLGVLLKRAGYGLDDPSRIERAGQPDPPAKPPPPMNQGRADEIAKHTGVPSDWFFEPDLSKLFGQADAVATRADLARLSDALAKKLADPDSDELDAIVDELRSTSGETPEAPGEGEDG